jgi:6-phosphogluconolactonase
MLIILKEVFQFIRYWKMEKSILLHKTFNIWTEVSIKKDKPVLMFILLFFHLILIICFLPDLGADKIRCYQFDETQKKPLIEAKVPFTKTDLESGPRHLTFHPNQKFGYCIEEMSGTVSVYQYENGTLNKIQRVNIHPDNITEGFESSDIHISPDGKFLYATNRGKENNIAIFSIAENGFLTNIGYQSTLGKHSRVFAIDETGKFLIVTNVESGNVVVFKRNPKTGLLKKAGKEIKMANVSCVQIRKI